MKLEVTFPKLYRAPFFSNERDHYELETFTYDCDPEKSGLENMDAAYEEALRRGHNPNKNIRIRALPDYDGEPCPGGYRIDEEGISYLTLPRYE